MKVSERKAAKVQKDEWMIGGLTFTLSFTYFPLSFLSPFVTPPSSLPRGSDTRGISDVESEERMREENE